MSTCTDGNCTCFYCWKERNGEKIKQLQKEAFKAQSIGDTERHAELLEEIHELTFTD